MSVKDFLVIFDRWAASQKARGVGGTLYQDRLTAISFARFIEDHCGLEFPLTEIPDRTLLKWAHLNTASVNTVSTRVQRIRQIFLYAWNHHLLPAPPILAFAKGPRPERRVRNPLTVEELHKIMDSLYGMKKPSRPVLRDRVLVRLALLGLRRGAMCSLKWSDLHETYFTAIEKGKKIRTFPIDDDFRKDLLAWSNVRLKASPYVVRSERRGDPAKPLGGQAMTYLFNCILKKAGIERPAGYAGPHLWRHTTGTLLYQRTKDMELVRQFLGHRFLSTTEGYVHTAPIVMNEAAQEIKSALSGPREISPLETVDYYRNKGGGEK